MLDSCRLEFLSLSGLTKGHRTGMTRIEACCFRLWWGGGEDRDRRGKAFMRLFCRVAMAAVTMIPPTTSLPNDDPKDYGCSRSHSVQGYHHPHDIEGDRAASLQQLSRPERFYSEELRRQNYSKHDQDCVRPSLLLCFSGHGIL
jgi:hypothetical protein